jgi:hypothetical protein
MEGIVVVSVVGFLVGKLHRQIEGIRILAANLAHLFEALDAGNARQREGGGEEVALLL